MNDSGWWECPNFSRIEGHSRHHYQLNEFVLEILALLAPTFSFLSCRCHSTLQKNIDLSFANYRSYVSYQSYLEVWCSHRWQARWVSTLAVEKDGLDLGQHFWVHPKIDQRIVWSKTFYAHQTFWIRNLLQRFCASLNVS
jgi:hypothetical protein